MYWYSANKKGVIDIMLIELTDTDYRRLIIVLTGIILIGVSIIFHIPIFVIVAVGIIFCDFILIPLILYLITPNDKIVQRST